MELFVAGKSLDDVEDTTSLLTGDSAALEPVLADEKQQILNDADFTQYQVFIASLCRTGYA